MDTKKTITAEKQPLCRLMKDLISDLASKKTVIVVTGLICFIVVALLFLNSCKSCVFLDKLFNANITLLSVDVAAIAFLGFPELQRSNLRYHTQQRGGHRKLCFHELYLKGH